MVHDGWFWGCLVGWFGFVLIVLRVLFARTPIPGTTHPYRDRVSGTTQGPTSDDPARLQVGRHEGVVFLAFSERHNVWRLRPAFARHTAEELRYYADQAEGIVEPSKTQAPSTTIQEPPRRTSWQRLDGDE